MWQPAPHRTQGAWRSLPVTLVYVVPIPSDISAAVFRNAQVGQDPSDYCGAQDLHS